MIPLAMNKGILVFSFFCTFGELLAVSVDPYHRHVIVSPHSASEIFYTGSERQVVPPAPVAEVQVPVAAPATPVAAIAPAAPVAFAGQSAALAPGTALPVAAPVPFSPVAPVFQKVAQLKLSYPQYAYGYSVQDFTTGDNKVAKEVREGEIVKGSYSVADPDGTKRTVNYYADPIHGFNAVVHKTQILK